MVEFFFTLKKVFHLVIGIVVFLFLISEDCSYFLKFIYLMNNVGIDSKFETP